MTMEKPKSIAEIMAEIKMKYDKNKNNWRVLQGRDSHGFYDTFFGHDSDLWHLKTEQLSPLESIGQGRLIKNIDAEIQKRIMSVGEPSLFGMLSPHPKEQTAIIASGLQRQSQKSAIELKNAISEHYGRNLDTELRQSVNKLLSKKFPLRRGLYS